MKRVAERGVPNLQEQSRSGDENKLLNLSIHSIDTCGFNGAQILLALEKLTIQVCLGQTGKVQKLSFVLLRSSYSEML